MSRYATFVRPMGEARPFYIACGPNKNDLDWTRRFFGDLRRGMPNGYSMHFYSNGNLPPLEYTPAAVEGKGLILSTTNGSVALTKAKHARLCYVAGFVNLSATIEALAQIKNLIEDGLTIICSGREEDFSLEDATCAGMLISKISSHPDLGPRLNQSRLTDSARAALSIFYEYGNDECDR